MRGCRRGVAADEPASEVQPARVTAHGEIGRIDEVAQRVVAVEAQQRVGVEEKR